jgi:hypothetical protein
VVVLKVADDILLTYDPHPSTLLPPAVRRAVECPHTSAFIEALFLLRRHSGIQISLQDLRPYTVSSYRLDSNGFYALVTAYSAHFTGTT